MFFNTSNIDWVSISIPILKYEDVMLFFLKGGLLIANVSVYSYLFAEIFLYVFHKRIKSVYEAIYENKIKYILETSTELMDKFNLAKFEFSQNQNDEQNVNEDEFVEETTVESNNEDEIETEQKEVFEDKIEENVNDKADEGNQTFTFVGGDDLSLQSSEQNLILHNINHDLIIKQMLIKQMMENEDNEWSKISKDFVNEETRNLWMAAEKTTQEKLEELKIVKENCLQYIEKNKLDFKEDFDDLNKNGLNNNESLLRICSKSCLCLTEKKIIECECHTNLELELNKNYIDQCQDKN